MRSTRGRLLGVWCAGLSPAGVSVVVSHDFWAADARFLHLDGTDHRARTVNITLHPSPFTLHQGR
ncbi:hypothetical protein ACFWBB_12530 [Streptomyces sp. NPDC060000]|uniref:hypothetical protein n=1 Tax=Streptomyces sp. NPDC060000 TaxID=3347031 RepID=UPI003699037F